MGLQASALMASIAERILFAQPTGTPKIGFSLFEGNFIRKGLSTFHGQLLVCLAYSIEKGRARQGAFIYGIDSQNGES